MEPLRHGVVLVGFMGAGKSTVGRALAARLGWRGIDLDHLLTERFGPIPAQVARDGWDTFRARERALVRELCATVEGGPVVVAAGGGAWVDAETQALLAARFRTVWLDAPLDVCAARVGQGAGRPAWDADVAERFDARRSVYARADLAVDAMAPVERVVEVIARWLEGP